MTTTKKLRIIPYIANDRTFWWHICFPISILLIMSTSFRTIIVRGFRSSRVFDYNAASAKWLLETCTSYRNLQNWYDWYTVIYYNSSSTMNQRHLTIETNIEMPRKWYHSVWSHLSRLRPMEPNMFTIYTTDKNSCKRRT